MEVASFAYFFSREADLSRPHHTSPHGILPKIKNETYAISHAVHSIFGEWQVPLFGCHNCFLLKVNNMMLLFFHCRIMDAHHDLQIPLYLSQFAVEGQVTVW